MQSHVMHITHRKYIRYVHAHGVNSLRIQFSGRRHVKHIVNSECSLGNGSNNKRVLHICSVHTHISGDRQRHVQFFSLCRGKKAEVRQNSTKIDSIEVKKERIAMCAERS